MPDRVAEAYELIDTMAVALRGYVEEHLENAPDAEFSVLLLLDDKKGGTTIAHSYENPDGSPDLPSALLGLGAAWRNLQKLHGGEPVELKDLMEKEKLDA